MIKALHTLFLAVLLNALIGIAAPFIQTSLYLSRLAALPAPGRLQVPVQGVHGNALRDSWHAERGGGRRHEGVDIFAPRGTPVRATTEGIVTRIGSNSLGGKVIWMLGPGGQRHYYAHLDGFAGVVSGQRVQAGAMLGFVGNTGNARRTPSHPHYGIYTPAGAINPFPLLVAGSPERHREYGPQSSERRSGKNARIRRAKQA